MCKHDMHVSPKGIRKEHTDARTHKTCVVCLCYIYIYIDIHVTQMLLDSCMCMYTWDMGQLLGFDHMGLFWVWITRLCSGAGGTRGVPVSFCLVCLPICRKVPVSFCLVCLPICQKLVLPISANACWLYPIGTWIGT